MAPLGSSVIESCELSLKCGELVVVVEPNPQGWTTGGLGRENVTAIEFLRSVLAPEAPWGLVNASVWTMVDQYCIFRFAVYCCQFRQLFVQSIISYKTAKEKKAF